jgi:hypothetical protein
MGPRDKSSKLDPTIVSSCSLFVPALCYFQAGCWVKTPLSLAPAISALALLGACDNGPSADQA